MLDILAAAAVAAQPVGPLDGLCLNHSRGGDNLCVMWTEEDNDVVVFDGYNTYRYNHVYGHIYLYHVNTIEKSHVLCSFDETNSFKCLFNISFQPMKLKYTLLAALLALSSLVPSAARAHHNTTERGIAAAIAAAGIIWYANEAYPHEHHHHRHRRRRNRRAEVIDTYRRNGHRYRVCRRGHDIFYC